MDIISVVLVLCVVGFILYLALTFIPMPAPFRQVIIVVVTIALILWLLQVFGLVGHLGNVRLR